MKHLLFLLLAFPFLASAQILEKQFVATVQYNGFTRINDSLYRGDLIEFRDVLIEGYQPSGVDSGFICLDGTGRAYRVEVVNSFDYSSLNVDLIELDDYDEIPIGVGIVAERYGSTYQIPNGLVNSIGISSVLQAKILNHNTKIAATTVQPPDTLYLQELSGTTAISNGDTIPLIDYVRVVDTPAMLLNYPSTAGYGIIDGGKTWRADTTALSGLATRKYTLLNPTSIVADRSIRSNGTNLVAGSWDDNLTRLLARVPVQFQSWTTAGRPTSTDGYYGKNTTTGFLEGYYTSQWENLITSTGASVNQAAFFANAGRITGDNNFVWDNTNKRLGIGVSSPTKLFTLFGQTGSQGFYIDKSPRDPNFWRLEKVSGGNGFIDFTNSGLNISDRLDLPATGVARIWNGQSPVGTGVHFYSTNYRLYIHPGAGNSNLPFGGTDGADVYIMGGDSNNSDNDITGGDVYIQGGRTPNKPISSYGNVILNWNNWGLVGVRTRTPSRTMDVNGELRIRDVITDSPTTLIGVDGDGDVGSFLTSGISISGGVFTAQNIYNTSGTLANNRVLRGDKRLSLYGKLTPLIDSINNVIAIVSRIDTTLRKRGTSPLTLWGARGASTIIGGNFNADTASQKGNIDGSIFIGTDKGFIEGGNNSYWDVVIGHDAKAKRNVPKRTVLGAFAQAIGFDATAIGFLSSASDRSTSIGSNAAANGVQSGAFGEACTANKDSSMAFGNRLTTTKNRQFLYGLSGNTIGTQAHHIMKGKFSVGLDSALSYDPIFNTFRLSLYGQGNREASDLSKTQSNYIAGFATDGTVLDLERKRDTTIYVIDTDYDFSAALTTTQVGNRYNRVIFLMTTTAAAGSDSELTLHTPDVNLMQVEYLVRSTDEAGGFANKIVFGTNNAVDSTNGLVTNYFPAAGQGVGIRAGLRSAVYKYFYY